ncbi:MAG: SUMF1/EgtB/PvdO family nonheme iron enzyme [Candidatus Cloacimonetes bacterium]|nr:SUMF1/EgtB/PvdO family nonheme iron enzyme [Candidatus Cloacimonadota bacterium]
MLKIILIIAVLFVSSLLYSGEMTIHLTNGTSESFEISDIEMITFGETPDTLFEWCTVPAGEYTYGWGDTIKTIDYDYQIMKNEVTNQQYVDYLEEAYAAGDIWIEGGYVVGYYEGDEHWSAGNYDFYDLGTPISGYNYARISWDGDSFIINVPSGYNPGDFDDHPVVYVTWFGSWAFAEHYGLRLPTEHEWEKAARGNTGWNYPWGDNIDGSRANYLWSGDPWDNGTTPVGMYNGQNIQGFQTTDSPSPYGVYDMAGNVWEWTDSWWSSSSSTRVLRSGGWSGAPPNLRSWSRGHGYPATSIDGIGFRCVFD